MGPEEQYEEELEIFVVETSKEDPAMNALFEQCKTEFRLS